MVNFKPCTIRPWDAWRVRDITQFADSWNGPLEKDYVEALFLNIITDATQGYLFAKTLFSKNVHHHIFQTGESALHHLVRRGNWPILELLLNYKPNLLQSDNEGNTPLHYLCALSDSEFTENFQKCMTLLLANGVDINAKNDFNSTPIDLAINAGNRKAVEMLLKSGKILHLDDTSGGRWSSRQCLMKTFPDLANQLPPELKKITAKTLLPLLLKEKKDKAFCSLYLAAKNRDEYIEYLKEIKDSLLRIASEMNMIESVRCLLNNGANPVAVDATSKKSAISEAGINRHLEVLALLLEKSTEVNLSTMTREFDINQTDDRGNTVLHYACGSNYRIAMFWILKAGGYLSTKNKNYDLILKKIPPKVLKQFFDDNISLEIEEATEKEELSFNYNFLTRPKTEKDKAKIYPELKLLNEITEIDELRHLLTHPVPSSFVLLKWQKLKAFYFMSVFIHLLLTLVITFNVCVPTSYDTMLPITRYTQLALIIFLLFQQSCLAVSTPKMYIQDFENYLQLGLVTIGGQLVLDNGPFVNLSFIFGPTAVALSWFLFVLLIAKHPKYAVKIKKGLRVLFNSFKYLSLFVVTYSALGFSFYVIVKECYDACYVHNIFCYGTPYLELIQNYLKSNGVEFGLYPATSQFVFFTFLFKGVVGFLSLINSLAHDSRTTRQNALINLRVSQIHYLASIEKILLGLKRLPVLRRLSERFLNFDGKFSTDKTDYFYPDQSIMTEAWEIVKDIEFAAKNKRIPFAAVESNFRKMAVLIGRLDDSESGTETAGTYSTTAVDYSTGTEFSS